MTAPLPEIALRGTWQVATEERNRTTTRLHVRHGTFPGLTVVLERCASGRLREAYPVGAHDVEARVPDKAVPLDVLTDLLRDVVTAVERSDPECRRIVFTATEGDLATIAAAEDAGLRYVVDVDIPDGSVSLLVAEPDWVTHVDMDLDHVPQT
jgi:hypothetical protein